jgi:hypothetical protein
MKTYKYSTKERAERVAKSLGCTGYHYHNEDGERKYMPCKTMKIFKEKTKKQEKGKEEEVTELIDFDGTWLTSDVAIQDPATTIQGDVTTDLIVARTKSPRDVFMRGGVSFRGESIVGEEDMERAFGFDDTRFMDYKKTVKHYQKELGLDKDSAEERAIQQGKKPNLHKRTPKKIKKKKNYIDRLILKEKDIEESENLGEDIILDKGNDYKGELKDSLNDVNPLLIRNIKSLKKMAKDNNITIQELIRLLKNEQ